MNLVNKRVWFLPFLAILLVMLPFLLGYFARSKNQYVTVYVISSGGEWWWQLNETPEWLREQVRVGDAEVNNAGVTNAEVVNVHKYGTSYNTTILAEVKIKVEKYSKQEGNLLYKGEPLLIGKALTLDLQKTQFSGNVVAIVEDPEDTALNFSRATVSIVIKNAEKWFAEGVKEGVLYEELDSQDHPLEKDKNSLIIVNNVEVRPAEEIVISTSDPLLGINNALLIAGKNKNRVDIYVDLEIPVLERNNVYYVNFYQPLKIGSDLFLSGNNIDLFGKIKSFKVINEEGS